MLLFDFPAELVSKILLHAVLARGITRALRLRLVCKRFSQEIKPALFESRLLDDFYTEKVLSDWYIENDHGASKFWHSYLVYRVQNKIAKPSQRRYLDIRLIAERVCEETGADVGATVETLCWPALQQSMNPSINSRLENEPPSPDLDLLCAAAYLNLIPIAKWLLLEGHSPHSKSVLFSSPMELAAWAGNAQMLEIFQDHVQEIEDLDPAARFSRNWRGKVGPASIRGAAIRGDVDMVRLAVYPPSRAAPDSTDFVSEAIGSVNRVSSTGNALCLAQWATRDVEVFKYLERFFSKPSDLSYILAKHARLGNLEMVRYLLDAGADTRGVCGRDANPLIVACRRCHEEVVDLLLERGADPNFDGDRERGQQGNPIAKAAASGSLVIVRKLLSHGADLCHENAGIPMGYHALYWAVRLEHTSMVKFLVAAGVDLGIYGETILETAQSLGLDSMVEVLRGEGVTLS
ncbi:MAG: hypothetical protein M1829_001659 [Trizodia sp. TS-e1964]|nr:MAG: hypothetical protein M1829_001659 [Trizodia sp. TS-e1964]